MTETSTYTHAELSARLAEVEQERDALSMELDACRHTNNGLHKDKVELAAMVGRLRIDAQGVLDADMLDEEDQATMYANLNDTLLMDAPTALRLMHYERNQSIRDAVAKARKEWAREDDQAIREIRAEAVEAHKQHLANQYGTEGCFLVDLHEFDEYSQQLRNGG